MTEVLEPLKPPEHGCQMLFPNESMYANCWADCCVRAMLAARDNALSLEQFSVHVLQNSCDVLAEVGNEREGALRARAEAAEERARELAAMVQGAIDGPPSQMSTGLGLLPINSTGMRQLVDAHARAEARVKELEATLEARRWCVHCGDEMGIDDDACSGCYFISRQQTAHLQELLDGATKERANLEDRVRKLEGKAE